MNASPVASETTPSNIAMSPSAAFEAVRFNTLFSRRHTNTQTVDTYRHTDTHRHTQTHTHSYIHTHTDTQRHRQAQTHTDTDADTHRHRRRHTQTHTHTQEREKGHETHIPDIVTVSIPLD